MDFLCAPERGILSIDNKCFAEDIMSIIDSLTFISFIYAETYFLIEKSFQRVGNRYLYCPFLIILCIFINLTLVIFYLPANKVSIAQVISLLLKLFTWLLIMNSFYNFSCTSSLFKTRLRTLKIFLLARFLGPIFWIYTAYKLFPSSSEQILTEIIGIISNAMAVIFALYVLISKHKTSLNALLQEKKEVSEYEKSSLYGKMTMSWVFPLLQLGSVRIINPEDIEKHSKHESCLYQSEKFEKIAEKYNSSLNRFNLLKVIYKCYAKEMIAILFLGLVLCVLDFTSPIFVHLLENYLNSKEPLWRGIALVVYLILSKMLQITITNYYNFLINLLQYHIQSALSSQIYKKLLKLSLSRISETPESSLSYGKIINIVHVDLSHFTTGITDSLKLATLPFNCGFGFYMLFSGIKLGGGITASIIVILLLIVNTMIGNKSSATQKKLMDVKDKKSKLCNEMLNNIRTLKLYNWEFKYSENLLKIREEELKQQTLILFLFVISIFLNWGTQDYMAAGVISTMAISGLVLTPTNVYASLAVMRVVNTSIFVLPAILNSLIQSKISLGRIEGYLLTEDQSNYITYQPEANIVEIKNASFAWKNDSKPESQTGELKEIKRVLKDLSFEISKGELVAIVGKVASGKSSLLQALIRNLDFIESEGSYIKVKGSIAYCSQEAWIQNKSIRENIIFGSHYDEERYWEVIRVCMLQSDLDILPGGDLTEIGEKGINLSGGQKTRVCLARAIYSNADIYIFDDSLAALDQYIGKKLFEEGILKFLKGKTRIFVINSQQYLSHCDKIIVLKSGKIKQIGAFDELINEEGYFKDKFMIDLKQSQLSTNTEIEITNKKDNKNTKLTESEDRATGSVKLSIYKSYYAYAGILATSIGFLLMILWQSDRMITDFFLASWTTQSIEIQISKKIFNIFFYVSGSLSVNLIILFTALNLFYSSIRAARILFKNLLCSLINAPISLFYDVNPVGRILNRLTKDMNVLDRDLVYGSYWFITQIFNVLMIISFCIFTAPLIALTLPVAAYLGLKVQKFYLSTSRELTRLESMSKSPVTQHFSETLTGLSTIRAFGYQDKFTNTYFELFDKSIVYGFYGKGCYCWITLYLELVFDMILAVGAFFIVYERDSMDTGLAGACLIYAMNLPISIFYLIMSASGLENSMVSTERVINMSNINNEGNRNGFKDNLLISSSWPLKGEIEFCKYSARYRPDTEIVLNEITFTVQPGEKIGIVGKTGSGKSSIVNALFRIFEATSGRILIDSIDIAEIGLDMLRQNMCVILQDPALFEGKIRDNIDMLKHHTDDEILNVLKLVQCGLGDNPLDLTLSENALNLSVGQKQLICIARALLKKTKIIIIDEATASIDYKTDMIIQDVIKNAFKDKTVLTIAHRINTIKNSDKIIVLHKGRVAEFDTPENLEKLNGQYSLLANIH